MREEEDTALTSPLDGPGAGLLLEEGGMGNRSQDKERGPVKALTGGAGGISAATL